MTNASDPRPTEPLSPGSPFRRYVPSADEPAALVPVEEDPPPVPFDVNGFDPNDFEWRPVPRRPRADGWTPEVQARFIEALADTGMVQAACEAVDMSVQSAYRLRRAPGGESFAHAWTVALDHAAGVLADLAFSRAIQGVDEPIYDRDGARIGVKTRYNDRMVMFLLRAYRPDQFRHAHESIRQPGEAPPPAHPPLAQAIAALAPVTPPDPHLLATPERLEDMIYGAEAIANYEANFPPDERERYQQPRIVEDGHPEAAKRRVTRWRRQREREERDAERYGDDAAG